jgi:uncharacterized protein YfaS (alpha-2-macroglobulin family)
MLKRIFLVFFIVFCFLSQLHAQKSIPDWPTIEKLINEQKIKAAKEKLDSLLLDSKVRNSEMALAEILTKRLQLSVGLGGYETAINELKQASWPQRVIEATTIVKLSYILAINEYIDNYSWEIRQREKTKIDQFDLRRLTLEELNLEILKIYNELWVNRTHLAAIKSENTTAIIQSNNYPQGVRSNFIDALSYLFSEFLANSSRWSPTISAQTSDLLFLELAKIQKNPDANVVVSPAVHPIKKIHVVLNSLFQFHFQSGQYDAALESRIVLYRYLISHASREDKLNLINQLKKELPVFVSYPWYTMGLFEVASQLRSLGFNKDAELAAQKALSVNSNSPGSVNCKSLIEQLHQPEYSLEGMRVDGSSNESFLVEARNVKTIYFRSYKYEIVDFLSKNLDYNLWPSETQLKKIMSQKPDQQWEANLGKSDDLQSHKNYLVPPIHPRGFYFIVSSLNKNFSPEENILRASPILFSSMALGVTTDNIDNKVKIKILDGQFGVPVAGVRVSLYAKSYNKVSQVINEGLTDNDGFLEFSVGFFEKMRQVVWESRSFYLVAKKNDDLAVSNQVFYLYPHAKPQSQTLSFIYTDRSVYRPEQKIQWKIVGYTGNTEKSKYQVVGDKEFIVDLADANSKLVKSIKVKTNIFGSANGEFIIPTGRLLGNWTITSRLSGSAAGDVVSVHIEEYKRPTFELKLAKQEQSLSMNHESELRGEAHYYFGGPVNKGKVDYRIYRQAHLPWWCFWYGFSWGNYQNDLLIKYGEVNINGEGIFNIKWTPIPDKQLSFLGNQMDYGFRVELKLTDEGGETQVLNESFSVSSSEVRASIKSEQNFALVNQEITFNWNITNAFGEPTKAKGAWRLFRLKIPEKTQAPNEVEAPSWIFESKPKIAFNPIPGDFKIPRWNATFDSKMQVYRWPDGVLIKSAEVGLKEGEVNSIIIKESIPGYYRLIFESVDRWGQKAQAQQEFLIGDKNWHPSLAAFLKWQTDTVRVGDNAILYFSTGWNDQVFDLEFYKNGRLFKIERQMNGKSDTLINVPVQDFHRGGFSVVMRMVHDYQPIIMSAPLFVPWDNKELKIRKLSFRDKINPGSKEKWSFQIASTDKTKVDSAALHVLAYMYDQSLDAIVAHAPPSPSNLYPTSSFFPNTQFELGDSPNLYIHSNGFSHSSFQYFTPDRFSRVSSYGIGGPGSRGSFGGGGFTLGATEEGMVMADGDGPTDNLRASRMAPEKKMLARGAGMANEINEVAPNEASALVPSAVPPQMKDSASTRKDQPGKEVGPMRSNFSETAFWYPNLQISKDGSFQWEFTVPDSLTSWKLWLHAFSKDMKYGVFSDSSKSSKDLMVKSYLPRFVREGDSINIQFLIYNQTDKVLQAKLNIDLLDQETQKSVADEFGLSVPQRQNLIIPLKAKESKIESISLKIPVGVKLLSVKVAVHSETATDAELNALPVLPGRFHLTESKTVILKGKDSKSIEFPEWKTQNDPSLIHDRAVITLDAQLFFSVLSAVPYLINYPYECVEQTLNRFLSAGIMSRLAQDFPSLKSVMKQMAERKTELEVWKAKDPNRLIFLEETPWLQDSAGSSQIFGSKGQNSSENLNNLLKPEVSTQLQRQSLQKLKEAQTQLGGFPWFPGGPPSPYITLYLLSGFARAHEFGVSIPKEMVQKAWSYLHKHYISEIAKDMRTNQCCYEFITYLNFVLNSYPDTSWHQNLFTKDEQAEMLNFSFSHWREHSPLVKGYLALTLSRKQRTADSKLVWDSVMDSASISETEGTYWAQEDRSWLWYNDTTESQAFALRVGSELRVSEKSLDGLVLWLFLNKKLNHWKSTKATAEVIYSLAHYLKKTTRIEQKESIIVEAGPFSKSFNFKPTEYTGKGNQISIPGESINPALSTLKFIPDVSSFAFATATWHYSTETIPTEAKGNFLEIHKNYFLRSKKGEEVILIPIQNSTSIQVGDELEVQISVKTKHSMEYVHLRDPRPSGFEPTSQKSQYRWDLGISWYEEIRDSGTNFFFEQLPKGEYRFKYRIRVVQSGLFKSFPAQIQSQYAPEFAAFSEGTYLKVVK